MIVTFTFWAGNLGGQIYGYFFLDSIPLWICRRRGGVWQPEYRLHTLWSIGPFIMPIGLGIFGATLKYHLHYMVLALGTFLVSLGALVCVPVTTNYVVECFTRHTLEASTAMGLYRLSFGLAIPFFVTPWTAKVGVGWVFGMAALFSLSSMFLIAVLIWRGQQIRRWSFGALKETYEVEEVDVAVGKGDDHGGHMG